MTATECSRVQFGTTAIAYSIRRSPRRGTVSIAVDPIEGVLVTAPQGTPHERLDRVVHQKAAWIISRLKRQSDLPPPLPEREFISGETFLYLGRQCRLRVVPSAAEGQAPAGVRLVGGRLVVQGGGDLRGQLVAWYRARATRYLRARVALWSLKIKVQPTQVLVRGQARRWGSCDAGGALRLNWRVIQAPLRLVDYVVAHELVHLRHPDHTPAFWAELGRVLPDYDRRRTELRKLGPHLTW
jgi:predicted metal-dependent hydrolase